MKKRYEKPSIASEKAFSMTAQTCDVGQQSPGTCFDNMRYDPCAFPYKVRDQFCPPHGIPPVAFS
jgi:hypothetical protein